jgi:formiminotetrahydrofolate cyclodeaminase
VSELAGRPLFELAASVASPEPAPGAGPSLAWTCGLAAALVEMVAAVALRDVHADHETARQRRDRASELRTDALALADVDVKAYTEVLAVMRRRDEPGHGARLRQALSQAAEPPLRIARTGAEVTSLAADAAADARGGVRGEAVTAAVLGEGVVRAVVRIVELNLGGALDDPRRTVAADLARRAAVDLRRAGEGGAPPPPAPSPRPGAQT